MSFDLHKVIKRRRLNTFQALVYHIMRYFPTLEVISIQMFDNLITSTPCHLLDPIF
jgi:hypothetical protein